MTIEAWAGGPDYCCRLLVGMQRRPQDELRAALGLRGDEERVDNRTATRLWLPIIATSGGLGQCTDTAFAGLTE